MKAESWATQKRYIDSADLVIWSCGYQSNAVPITDALGSQVQHMQKVPNTQYDVNKHMQIFTQNGAFLTKTFGIGLGFPTRTKDGMSRPEKGKQNPRADSFSLYYNWVGWRMVKNLLPKEKLKN